MHVPAEPSGAAVDSGAQAETAAAAAAAAGLPRQRADVQGRKSWEDGVGCAAQEEAGKEHFFSSSLLFSSSSSPDWIFSCLLWTANRGAI